MRNFSYWPVSPYWTAGLVIVAVAGLPTIASLWCFWKALG